jgi:hypothetical protein
MILVGLLTLDQYDQIVGQLFAPDSFFNPIQDFNDNWIISQEEMDFCTNIEFIWVKDLPLIEYIPKEQPYPPL